MDSGQRWRATGFAPRLFKPFSFCVPLAFAASELSAQFLSLTADTWQKPTLAVIQQRCA
jgi:hypothetical protein